MSEQKRAAARHCPAHGRRDALARREPGYPKCTSKLAERADGHAPGERRSTQPRVLGAPEGAAAVKAPASRASSAREVADQAGCTRTAPCKWKREPLREEPRCPKAVPASPHGRGEGRLRPRRIQSSKVESSLCRFPTLRSGHARTPSFRYQRA